VRNPTLEIGIALTLIRPIALTIMRQVVTIITENTPSLAPDVHRVPRLGTAILMFDPMVALVTYRRATTAPIFIAIPIKTGTRETVIATGSEAIENVTESPVIVSEGATETESVSVNGRENGREIGREIANFVIGKSGQDGRQKKMSADTLDESTMVANRSVDAVLLRAPYIQRTQGRDIHRRRLQVARGGMHERRNNLDFFSTE
jgi:hypothetical protein